MHTISNEIFSCLVWLYQSYIYKITQLFIHFYLFTNVDVTPLYNFFYSILKNNLHAHLLLLLLAFESKALPLISSSSFMIHFCWSPWPPKVSAKCFKFFLLLQLLMMILMPFQTVKCCIPLIPNKVNVRACTSMQIFFIGNGFVAM